jgi:hypothetical protein
MRFREEWIQGELQNWFQRYVPAELIVPVAYVFSLLFAL